MVAAGTGAPLRRVQIRASARGVPLARFATTDAEGRFELRNLPAGQWMLAASRSGFVTQRFGQRHAFQAVDPIDLSAGERFGAANFALPRGGVITGRVYDELGEPIAGLRVEVLRWQMVDGQRRLSMTGLSDQSDDTGAYRIYGLAPGDYYVAASHRSESVDGTPSTPLYAPTYFPGGANSSEAQRVSVGAGEEQANITFQVLPLRAVRVTGRVVASGGAPLANGLVILENPLDSSQVVPRAVGNVMTDGTFTLANVPSGSYVLDVMAGPGTANPEREVASLPITVGDEDLSGIIVTTGKGASVSGRVTAEGAGAALPRAAMRIVAQSMRGTRTALWEAAVNQAGTFRIGGLLGPHLLRLEGLPDGWMLKSFSLNGLDVTDTPTDLRGTEQISDAEVVLTNRLTGVAGRVTSGGKPARGATTIVFSEDSTKWTFPSRYVRSVVSDDQGRFALRALPPDGHYLAIAVDYLEDGEAADPEFLQQMVGAASRFSLREGESRELALTVTQR